MMSIPVYLIAVPIGSYLSDMPISSLQQIQATKILFIESKGRLVNKLLSKGYITAEHQLIPMDKDSLKLAQQFIQNGKSFALLADTGNPCFVDPGYEIVRYILDFHLDYYNLVPLGMSSALDAALSMSGLDIQRFHFCGHFPDNYLEVDKISDQLPLVFYVAGKGVRNWIEWVETRTDQQIITLYRNIRDRNGGQIYRSVLNQRRWSEHIQNHQGDNYVGIVQRRMG